MFRVIWLRFLGFDKFFGLTAEKLDFFQKALPKQFDKLAKIVKLVANKIQYGIRI